MDNIAEIRQNIDDFEKFKNGIKKFFDKVDEGGQEVSTINNWFSFLSKYGYKASCGFGKGKLSRYPFIVFIRTDSGYQSASKGVYCRVNIKRNTDEISVEINESKNNKIAYKAKQDCEQYNKKKLCQFKRNDLDDIVEQVLKDMEWFAKLPLDSIKEIANTRQDSEIQQPNIDLNQTKGKNMIIPPLNQILYGPPGTGKTYKTINKALEILGEQIEGRDRAELKAKFDEYRQNGQIEFVTFHQSFSYEEFVEGIKPKLIDSSEGAESSKMSYIIKNGIFKEICDRALYKEFQFKSEELEIQANTKTRVWKISIVAKSEKEELRNKVLKHCFEKDEIRIGWSDNRTLERISVLGRNDQSSIYQFENEADIGDIVCVFENANGDIKGIGIIESEFYWDDKADNSEVLKLYPRVRKVKWLSNEQINIRDLNGGTNLTQKTFYPLDRINAIELLNRIGKLDKKDLVVDNTQKPFVLIIDEINRGNISKILGELITLIEPSKRIGSDEELRVTLPYSNDEFGVPSNLYIIGTMNTADRSIALLDTALRRRFEFVEMMPNAKLLEKIKVENDEIDLQKLLIKMNERIEFLLDREHTIGHSFFIGVDSLDRLREVFKIKIIPLLQEYFYDDYAKIQAVLNDNDMIKPKPKPEFLPKFSDEVDSEKVVYEIEKEWQKWESWQFVKIYNSKATKTQSQDSTELGENEPK